MRWRFRFDHRFREGPRSSPARRLATQHRLHLALGIVSRSTSAPHRPRQRCSRPCRTACSIWRASNCATSSVSSTALTEYSQYGEGCRSAPRRRAPATIPAAVSGLDPQMQGLGGRSGRLHLFHHSSAGLGSDLRPHRQAGLENRSGLRDAAGAAARLKHIFATSRNDKT